MPQPLNNSNRRANQYLVGNQPLECSYMCNLFESWLRGIIENTSHDTMHIALFKIAKQNGR